MCRLLLMNRQAFQRIDNDLEAILRFLMATFGGDGNGVAALWPDGTTRVAKAVEDDEHRSATLLRRYRNAGANWFVFHTRRASIGEIRTSNCHPFRFNQGSFVLAHNGHDTDFARWGRLIKKTDSECIARTWATLHLPVSALVDVQGVFVGFHDGAPFVVKGAVYTDLYALWDEEAVLVASELPWYVEHSFEYAAPVGRCIAADEEALTNELFASLSPWSSQAYASWLSDSPRWWQSNVATGTNEDEERLSAHADHL